MTTDSPSEELLPEEPGAVLIKRLFDRFEVPKRSRSRKVEAILEVSYAAAHRRVCGELPITVAEVERIAAHFGATMADIVVADFVERAAEATIALGPVTLPCRLWLGGRVPPGHTPALVAVQRGTQWMIVPPAQAPDEATWVVNRFLCDPSVAQDRPRVAVLDDTAETADAVSSYLRTVGFEAEDFSSVASLRGAMQERRYDAYIVDWLLDRTTAAELLKEIRAADPLCPIAVLTGKLREGKANASEVAAVVDGIDAEFYEKPAPMPIIAGRIKKLLALRATA